jgi:hypothetical protein
MNRLFAPAFAALVCASPACGGEEEPRRLYLALLDSELTVQLVENEPGPY